MLRVHHLLATTILADPFPDRESAFDAYNTQFNAIVSILDAIISQDYLQWGPTGYWPFGLDTGIIPPLFFTAIKCRDASISQRAVALLYRVPRCEGMWDAQESARVAQLAIEFEELHRASTPDASIPSWARLHDVDINPRDDDSPSRQLVCLRWLPDGVDGSNARFKSISSGESRFRCSTSSNYYNFECTGTWTGLVGYFSYTN